MPTEPAAANDDVAPVTQHQSAQRIGLFGGTFDPIHHGHLAAAWSVRQLLGLDEVWLVVANDPWQKSGGRQITNAAQRLAWVELAVADVVGLEASSVEIDAGGPSYTIDTVETLRSRFPEVEWSVVVGADVVGELHTWHRADDLRSSAEVIAVNRPGSSLDDVSDGWTVQAVTVPPMDVSSTQLRELAARDLGLHFLVPVPVAEDIHRSGCYRRSGGEPGDAS